MKVFLITLSMLAALPVFAAPTAYRINSQLFIDGKLVASPKILTLAGEAAEITQTSDNPTDKLSFKVIPQDFSNDKIKDGILMNFAIEYTDGSRSVKISPQVIAKPDSEASISIGKGPNKEDILLKVIATRE